MFPGQDMNKFLVARNLHREKVMRKHFTQLGIAVYEWKSAND